MIRLVFVLLIWIYFIGFAPITIATNHICSQKEAQEAEEDSGIVRSWEQSYLLFQRYKHCDDGAIAEGFSESISVLLSAHWTDISSLGKTIKFDPSFYKFVIKHIDETVPTERLRQIEHNASTQCPQNLKKLCRDIQVTSKSILEMAPLQQ